MHEVHLDGHRLLEPPGGVGDCDAAFELFVLSPLPSEILKSSQ